MGRDKALLSLPGSEILLWQQQLHVLEELKPANIFWSGAARPNLPGHLRLIADEIENAGPLAGISACLNALAGDLLVVLAIDLPRMNADFLRNLLARCSASRGAVAQNGRYFEPLAAVYPKNLRALAAEHLEQNRYTMQDFIREAVRLDLLEVVSLSEYQDRLFKNVNSPADLKYGV